MGRAHFCIALDNPNEPVLAGTHLTGNVWADIFCEIKGTEMQVQLIGAEKTKVTYTAPSAGGGSAHQTAHAQRPLIQANLPVNQFQMIQNGKIPPGRYKLPFDVELPECLPSSMHLSCPQNSCKIVYKIKATLKGSGMVYNYNCERDVVVKAKPLEKVKQPFEGAPSSVKVKFMCGLNRGSMTVGAHMEDTIIEKGETAQLSLSCRNHTTVRVKRVEAVLKEVTKWHLDFSAKPKYSHSYSHILQQLNFGTQGLERQEQLLPRGDSLRNDEIEMLQELRSGANTHVVTMPLDAHNTYSGHLMSTNHFVIVRVVTNCCIDNPEIQIPIRTGERSMGPQPSSSGPVFAVAHPVPSAPVDLTATPLIPPNCGDAIQSPIVYVQSGDMVTGGSAIGGEDEEFVIPAIGEAVGPSIAVLFKEMNDSVADLVIVRKRIGDPDWSSVMRGMSSSEYGKMVKLVDLDFDQPKIAVVVAEQIPNFTCQYVVAAVRVSSEWNRSTMVETLIPMCKDLAANKQMIINELSDWGRTVTERAFQKALRR